MSVYGFRQTTACSPQKEPTSARAFSSQGCSYTDTAVFQTSVLFPQQGMDLIWRQCQFRERGNPCSFQAASVVVQS